MAVFGEAHFSFFPPPLPPLRPDADSPPWQGCSFWGGGGPEGGGGSVGQPPSSHFPKKAPLIFVRGGRLVAETIAVMVFSLSLSSREIKKGGEGNVRGRSIKVLGWGQKREAAMEFLREKSVKGDFRVTSLGGSSRGVVSPPPSSTNQPGGSNRHAPQGQRGGGEEEGGTFIFFPQTCTLRPPPSKC